MAICIACSRDTSRSTRAISFSSKVTLFIIAFTDQISWNARSISQEEEEEEAAEEEAYEAASVFIGHIRPKLII
jgi:hypothetical protein